MHLIHLIRNILTEISGCSHLFQFNFGILLIESLAAKLMYMNIAHELQRQQLVNAYNKAVKRKDWKSAKNYRDELSILIAQKNMYENHLRTK